MLLFVDESYQQVERTTHLAIGGVLVSADRYRQLMACVYQLKQRYFISNLAVDCGDPDALRTARQRGVLVDGEVTQAELKANKLLGPRVARHYAATGSAIGFELVQELLGSLHDLDARVFGTLSEVHDVQAVLRPRADLLPRQLAFLLERANDYAAGRGDQRVICTVFDSVHLGQDHGIEAGVSNFMFRTSKGQQMRQIVPQPFFVNSMLTPGLQVADIVSYLLRLAMAEEHARLPWQLLIDQVYRLAVRREDGKVHSIYRIYDKVP